MKHFSIRTNPLFIFGEKKVELLPELLKAREVKHLLLVTGTSSFTNSGYGKSVERMLKTAGIEYVREMVRGEPSPELIDGITHCYKNGHVDAILSIGGGSVIDTGKAVSAMLPIQGKVQVEDYLEGVGAKAPPGEKLFFVAVPTTAGTGSEATKNAVISNLGKGEDRGGVEENCNSLIEILNKWISQFKVPRLGSYGIAEGDLPIIVEKCGVKNTPVKLNQDDIQEILRDRL